MSAADPVKGLKGIIDQLSALGPRIEKQVIRSGLTAAAGVVRDEARLRVPRVSGLTAAAIQSGSPRKNQDGSYSIRVSLKGNRHAFLGWFIEKGVAPHFISAGDSGYSTRVLGKKAKRGEVTGDVKHQALKIGETFISGAVFHPGSGAHPFLVPALEARQTAAIQAFRDKIVAVVERKTGFNMEAGLGAAVLDEAA